jgi:hypothetical protein
MAGVACWPGWLLLQDVVQQQFHEQLFNKQAEEEAAQQGK